MKHTHVECRRVVRAVRVRRVTRRTIALAQSATCPTGKHRDLLRAVAAWNPDSLPKDQTDWEMLEALR